MGFFADAGLSASGAEGGDAAPVDSPQPTVPTPASPLPSPKSKSILDRLQSITSDCAAWSTAAMEVLAGGVGERDPAALAGLLERHGALEADCDLAPLVESEVGNLADHGGGAGALAPPPGWSPISDPSGGTRCWAKFRGLPYWPAVIVDGEDAGVAAALADDAWVDLDVQGEGASSQALCVRLLGLAKHGLPDLVWVNLAQVLPWRKASKKDRVKDKKEKKAKDKDKGGAEGDVARGALNPNLHLSFDCPLLASAVAEAHGWSKRAKSAAKAAAAAAAAAAASAKASGGSGSAAADGSATKKKKAQGVTRDVALLVSRKRARLEAAKEEVDITALSAQERLQVCFCLRAVLCFVVCSPPPR
jgi:hypothetical protein